MTIDGGIFTPASLWAMNLLFALALFGALRMAPWGKLRNVERLHVFLVHRRGAPAAVAHGGAAGAVLPPAGADRHHPDPDPWYLPKHFFVYVPVNGFLTAALLVASYTFAELDQTLLPFSPLMFLPEAILNG